MKRVSPIILSLVLGSAAVILLTSILNTGGIKSLLADGETVQYTITELGTLGGTESLAVDVNNLGQIIGSSTISDGFPATAFVWEEGTMIPLTVTFGVTTTANSINDGGLIAGVAVTEVNTTTHQFPVLWAGGVYTELATISDTQGVAQAVNNLGLIAGNTITESNNHLLLWQNESLTLTIPISGGVGWVGGLNAVGQIAGHIEDSPGNESAFLWATNVFTGLGTLGGSGSIAHDLNDLGQIVGSSTISDDLTGHAFLWENGLMIDLGTIGDVLTRTSQANGINNGGIIVGQAQVDGEDHAVLWEDGQILDLNNVLPAESGWDLLQTAASINDEGWIVGTGLIGGNRRAFLLRPASPLPPIYMPVIMVPEATPMPPTATPTPSPTPTPTPVPSGVLDMNRFLIGDGRLYEVQHSSGSQARHQTQLQDTRFFHTKGNEILAEWEELWSAGGYIYRGTDTSPGNGRYYSLYADSQPGSPVGSRWSPRYWRVGDIYFRNAYVVVREKSNCSIVPNGTGWAPTWLKLEAFYPSYKFASGITLQNVIQLAWLQNLNQAPQERYYYAANYGLVGWSSADSGHSYISEIHGPGQRPNNQREAIPCMGLLNQPLKYSPELSDGLLPEKFLRMVK